MFLIRSAFWLFLIVMLIPTGESAHQDTTTTADNDLSAFQAIAAAQHTVSDLAGFCDRNPDTCQTGSAVFRTFGHKAQYGAKMLYDYLSEADFGGDGTDRPTIPGSDTLRASDRDIPWQGPEAQS